LRKEDTSESGRIVAHYENINQELDHLLFYQEAGDSWYVRMPNGGLVFRAVLTAIMNKCMSSMKDQGVFY